MYRQCQRRTNRHDSGSWSNVCLVTCHGLEQCHGIQSDSQPKHNDNLYINSDDDSEWLYG
jgi:hypothetical protein